MKPNSVRIQSTISLIFSFLLTVLFLLLFILLGLYFGAFNEKLIKQKINESNYYNETYSIIYSKAESIVKDAGLPVSVLENAITLERIYIGGKYYVEDILSGKEPAYKTDKLETVLYININNYLTEQHIVKTPELEAGMGELTERLLQEYRRGIQFDFIKSISRLRQVYLRIIMIGLPALLILMSIIIYSLIRMHKYLHRALRYINYGVIAASLFTGVIAAVMLFLLKIHNKVTVQPEYYSLFLRNYFKWDIQVFLYIAGLGAVLTAILFIITGQSKNSIS